MTENRLSTLALVLISMLAVACGEADAPPFEGDPGFGGEGGSGGAPVDPIDLIAPFDNDSADNPAMDEFLSITNDRELAYSGLISSEDGDTEDFVQFELPNNSNPNQRIDVAIDCTVEGDTEVFARVEILNVGNGETTAATGGPIDCNDGFVPVTVRNDRVQAVRIYVQGVPEEQTLIEYALTVAPF